MKLLLLATAALFFAPQAHAQDDEGCYNRLTQDVNCNVIDETDEVPVDLELELGCTTGLVHHHDRHGAVRSLERRALEERPPRGDAPAIRHY